MKISRRELLIDMVFDWVLKHPNDDPCCIHFTFIPKTGMGLPIVGIIFHCKYDLIIFKKN